MWQISALAYALITSLHIPIIKRISSRVGVIAYVFTANLFIIPIMLITVLAVWGMPSVHAGFYAPMIIASLLDTAAFLLAVLAFSSASISLVVPLAAVNPIFTTITSMLFLHERAGVMQIIGIVIVVLGAYLLNVAEAREGLLTPFRSLIAHRGVQYFVLANLLWAVTPLFQKLAIEHTAPHAPPFVALVGTMLISVYLLPFVIYKRTDIRLPLTLFPWLLVLCGFLVTFQQFALQFAFSLTNVGYVAAVGKLSSVFIVLWGLSFFKEGRMAERLTGCIVMVVGSILITL